MIRVDNINTLISLTIFLILQLWVETVGQSCFANSCFSLFPVLIDGSALSRASVIILVTSFHFSLLAVRVGHVRDQHRSLFCPSPCLCRSGTESRLIVSHLVFLSSVHKSKSLVKCFLGVRANPCLDLPHFELCDSFVWFLRALCEMQDWLIGNLRVLWKAVRYTSGGVSLSCVCCMWNKSPPACPRLSNTSNSRWLVVYALHSWRLGSDRNSVPIWSRLSSYCHSILKNCFGPNCTDRATLLLEIMVVQGGSWDFVQLLCLFLRQFTTSFNALFRMSFHIVWPRDRFCVKFCCKTNRNSNMFLFSSIMIPSGLHPRWVQSQTHVVKKLSWISKIDQFHLFSTWESYSAFFPDILMFFPQTGSLFSVNREALPMRYSYPSESQ